MIRRQAPIAPFPYSERCRIGRALAAAGNRRLTLIHAAGGSGKTVALEFRLEEVAGPSVLHRIRFEHGKLPLFVRALVDSIDTRIAGFALLYAAAFPRLYRQIDPWTVIAAWICERLVAPLTIAIDQFERTDEDAAIAPFVAQLIDRSPAHVRWIVATRTVPILPVARWLAEETMDVPIETAQLEIRADEIVALAATLHVSASGLTTIAAKHGASIGAVVTELLDLDAAYRMFEARRDHLIALAALSHIDARTLAAMPAPMVATFDELCAIPHACKNHDDHTGWTLGEEPRSRAWAALASRSEAVPGQLAAASILEDAGASSNALALYVSAGSQDDILRTLDAHGDVLAEHGASDIVAAAIEALDSDAQLKSSMALASKAAEESHRGRYDTAESWFAQALALPQSNSQRVYVEIAYATDGLRRYRSDVVERFEALRAIPTTPARAASIVASLATAYAAGGRLDEARVCLREALARIDDVAEPLVRARVHQRVAFVALSCGDDMFAQEHAELAASLGRALGDDELVAVARTTTYVVAISFHDDHVSALRALAEIGRAAVSTRSRFFERFAMIGEYLIHTERGDREAIRALDPRLDNEELEASAQQTEEGVLPARAMQQTWSGDFAGAFRSLAASVKHHAPPDLRALHSAEAAFYAAAAGFDAEARSALLDVHAAVRQIAGVENVETVKADLLSALASHLMGRRVATRTFLRRAARRLDRWPRWRSLHAVSNALALMPLEDGDIDLLAHFEHLASSGLGGFARMIEAIPQDLLGGLNGDYGRARN